MTERRPSCGRSPCEGRPLPALAAALALCAGLPAGCDSGAAAVREPNLQSAALAAPAPSPGALFERMEAGRSGIDFTHRFDLSDDTVHLLDNGQVGGGVTVGDYDGDGRPDVFLTRPHGGNRLYRNLGDFRFEDATRKAGLPADDPWGLGASFADVDGDGDLDLYVCSYDHPNRLYVNRGDGRFEERGAAAGLDFRGASVMMAFADYDRDGDLDGYLLTNYLHPPPELMRAADHFRRGCETERRCDVPAELRELHAVLYRRDGSPLKVIKAAQADRLYRNEGDGRFRDVSAEAGISGRDFGLSATWWDYDADGFPDLYVANDFYGADQLLHNDGDGRFTDVSKQALPHTPWFSMGTDVGDVNDDGRLDLIGTDMSSTNHFKSKLSMGDMDKQGWFLVYPEPRQYMRNALYLNTGTGRFMEVAQLAGLSSTDWTWSPKFGDLDNDGRIDLFVSNGMTRQWFNSDLRRRADELSSRGGDADRMWMDSPPLAEANLAFRNLGDLRFQSSGPAWGLDHVGVSFGAALSDLDGDGDLDLVVNDFQEPASVYRNGSADGHRVLVRLQGRASNRRGIGARLELAAGSHQQVRYLTLARGFASTNDDLVHFGLGPSQSIDRLTVRWPAGGVQEFRDLRADRLYTVVEPAGAAAPGPEPARAPLFARSAALEGIRHRETPFDDFAREPLLPNSLSQLGPGIAFADVDGDGDDDLYLGGAAGQRGFVYLRGDDGRFSPRQGAYTQDASEDMGALFFDADSDGDLDLYVVSGGVEAEPGDAVLRDRLYLNDGAGGFAPAPAGALPDDRDSGSIATAADFDRDGDLDVFVGARTVPGAYPTVPASRLLRNAGGRFEDATDALAPGLRSTGLVTSALWSDADGDGWIDLLVTHEWGPVKLWRNEQGRLVDRTREAGLADRSGWFHGIAARDLDNDGDIDYAVTNMGLNTKYKDPHADEPVQLFYGSFDDTRKRHLVEATLEHDTLFPVRGRSCSSAAIAGVGDRFPSFESFARASLPEIYSQERLDRSMALQVNALESGVLINDGGGRFRFAALPRLAQASPGFGVVLTDFDADGRTDLYLGQNFYTPQPETGRMDGGLSLLLRGNGDGSFEPLWPDRSGLVAPGDVKGVVTTDLDGDGWVDFAVAANDGELLGFENRSQGENRALAVRLRGPAGNREAVGARVALRLADGTAQTTEVHAGSSYLSQSSALLFFGLGRSGQPAEIEVRWPSGRVSRTPLSEATASGSHSAGDGEIAYRIGS